MRPVKKTWLIDPELVKQVQRISGCRTETETVVNALRDVVTRAEIDQAFHLHGPALADLVEVFPDPPAAKRQ